MNTQLTGPRLHLLHNILPALSFPESVLTYQTDFEVVAIAKMLLGSLSYAHRDYIKLHSLTYKMIMFPNNDQVAHYVQYFAFGTAFHGHERMRFFYGHVILNIFRNVTDKI